MKMCNAFAFNGHETYLTSKNTGATLSNVKDIYKFYGVKPDFKLIRKPGFSFPGAGRFYNFTIPFFGFGNYDLVYTRSIYAAFWYTLFNKPIVFEIHEPFESKNKFLGNLLNYIIEKNNFEKIVVISDALKQYFLKNYQIDPNQIIVAADGADEIPENTKPVALKGEYNVGYVGSLLIGKGIELIVPLSKKLKNVNFHIVGGNESQINHWKEKLTDSSNIIFHGSVPHSKTAEYIKAFDVLLAPYQDKVFVKKESNSNNIAQWMSPLKIFEYMASGNPIISSDLPVIREVLQDTRNCLLCRADNLESWEEAILKLKKNSELSSTLAENAKEDFDNYYTWNKRSKRILSDIFSEAQTET